MASTGLNAKKSGGLTDILLSLGLKETKWKYKSSSGFSISFDLSISGGEITFTDPTEREIRYRYAAIGAGAAAAIKLPKIGKVKFPNKGSNVGGTTDAPFDSGGKLFITSTFSRDELSVSDVAGMCVFVEAGGGVIAGVSTTIMLLNVDPSRLPDALVAGNGLKGIIDLLTSAKAVLGMGGPNAGIHVGVGFTGNVGYLRNTYVGIRPIEFRVKLHIVAKGETLSGLALKYYHEASRWKEIYDYNKEIIGPNPNFIKPDQRLIIPDLK